MSIRHMNIAGLTNLLPIISEDEQEELLQQECAKIHTGLRADRRGRRCESVFASTEGNVWR